jgi:hypothetical protein
MFVLVLIHFGWANALKLRKGPTSEWLILGAIVLVSVLPMIKMVAPIAVGIFGGLCRTAAYSYATQPCEAARTKNAQKTRQLSCHERYMVHKHPN